eukprot:6096652-Amphidinium_carterae.1
MHTSSSLFETVTPVSHHGIERPEKETNPSHLVMLRPVKCDYGETLMKKLVRRAVLDFAPEVGHMGSCGTWASCGKVLLQCPQLS